jgi:hypothetical protein
MFERKLGLLCRSEARSMATSSGSSPDLWGGGRSGSLGLAAGCSTVLTADERRPMLRE